MLLLFPLDLLCFGFSCVFAWDLASDLLVQETESTQAAGSWWKGALFHTTDSFIVEPITVGYCRGLTRKQIQKITDGMSTLSQKSLYLYTFRNICKEESFDMCRFLNAFLNTYYLSLQETKWWLGWTSDLFHYASSYRVRSKRANSKLQEDLPGFCVSFPYHSLWSAWDSF